MSAFAALVADASDEDWRRCGLGGYVLPLRSLCLCVSTSASFPGATAASDGCCGVDECGRSEEPAKVSFCDGGMFSSPLEWLSPVRTRFGGGSDELSRPAVSDLRLGSSITRVRFEREGASSWAASALRLVRVPCETLSGVGETEGEDE